MPDERITESERAERGFILQPTYRIESGRPVVHLYGRLKSGRPFLVRHTRQTPHFYVRAEDADRARALGAGPLSPAGKVTFSGAPVVRVEVAVPADVPPMRDRLAGEGIVVYEGDVRFALRGLIDRGIRGSLSIAGPSREERRPAGIEERRLAGVEERRLAVWDDPEIAPADWTPELSVLAFDIETDPGARRLLAVSLVGCGASEVLLLTPEGAHVPAGAIPFANERDLLRAFARRVRELDPDVLTGWNVIDFDLSVLVRIAERLGVAFEPGRGPGGVRIQPARFLWGTSQASVPGRVVLDGIQLLRGAFIRREEYSLDAVARDVLGEGKTLAGHGRAGEILRMFREDRSRFVEYSLTDSRLALEIVEKLRLVELAVERSRLTGMPPDRVAASIAAFDFLYLSELSRRGIVAPSVRNAPPAPSGGAPSEGAPDAPDARPPEGGGDPVERDLFGPMESTDPIVRVGSGDADLPPEFFKGPIAAENAAAPESGRGEDSEVAELEGIFGGTVLEPEPGLYRNVLVFDFKSLYPSLIRTFQIDPLGHIPPRGPDEARPGEARPGEARPGEARNDAIVAPNGAAFRREPGILPMILEDLFPRREEAKRAGDHVKANAIKILMNSFYGVLGTPACRFASPEVANAITSFGREVLLWSKARFEEAGLRVLYGDTDSLFVLSGEDDPESARRSGAALAARLDREIAEFVAERWRVESRLELELEGVYARLLLPHVRHGAEGARKRYAGLLAREDGTSHVVFTGLEVVRRDWTELAREVQRELYERLFSDRAVGEYLRAVVEDLRAGRHDARLVYRKALRKPLREYTAATPPHVAAARKMARIEGRVIAYVITTSGPEPASEAAAPLDHEHYVQKQIRPIAEPVLEVLGGDFDRIVGDTRQLELF